MLILRSALALLSFQVLVRHQSHCQLLLGSLPSQIWMMIFWSGQKPLILGQQPLPQTLIHTCPNVISGCVLIPLQSFLQTQKVLPP